MESNVEHYPSLFNRPRNIVLLPITIVLHHSIAGIGLAYGIYFNSLAFFANGAHLILNGIILTNLFTSTLINWRNGRYYSVVCVEFGNKINFALGLVFGCFGVVFFYMSLNNLFRTPIIQLEAMSFLVPLPGFVLNMASIYMIVTGYENLQEQSFVEKKAVEGIYYHLLASSFGSFGVIVSSYLLQNIEFMTGDAIFALFNAILILRCSMNLVNESIESTIVLRQDGLLSVSSYVKDNIVNVVNIFNM